MSNSGRIFANTVASYVRLLVVSCSALVTIPLALRVLGPSDYGVFSVIGGCLSFLLFINGALISGAQRHIAYAIGEEDADAVRRWFHTSVAIHLVLSAFIAVVALSLSHAIVCHLLSLPAARIGIARLIYKMVVLVIACNILSAPYQGLLLAHESIIPLSLIDIGGAILFLTGTMLLGKVPGDQLLWYAEVYVFAQIVLYAGPILYCVVRYPICRSCKLDVTREKVSELVSFSGWNLFGAFASVARAQGPAIVLNIFVGTIVNAAYGLALQISNFAVNLGSAISRATTSPIIKLQASNDKSGMEELTNLTNLSSFGVLWVLIAPFMFEAPFCLGLWLHRVPADTSVFAVILLLSTLIDQLTSEFIVAVQAVGKIAMYQIVVGSVNLLIVPLVYVFLRTGFAPAVALSTCVACKAVAGILRVSFASALAQISVRQWMARVLVPACLCMCITSVAFCFVRYTIPAGLLRFCLSVVVNAAIGIFIIWKSGLTCRQREVLQRTLFRTVRSLAGLSFSER